ncbi:MAG: hypothetical protein QW134_02695 [Nitrososphaeria archaeon]
MFSKTELNFLEGKNDFDKNYRRVLKYRIIKKLNQFERIIPILE